MQSWIKLVWLGVAIVGANGNLFGLAMPLMQSDAAITRSTESTYIRPRVACPEQLEDLIPLLLRDLPAYANRVSQRSYIEEFRITENIPGTIILAGQPEYQPIELASQAYIPIQEDTTRQVFFTTLERQYTSEAIVDLQHYYWLFLTQTQQGWRLVFLFSSLGDVPLDQPPTPPQDASQGVVAQAIRLWLRDCRAGSILLP